MKKYFAILSFIFSLSYANPNFESPNPRVRLSTGVIEGRLMQTTLGAQGFVFQGIPYVEPPVGRLRFAKPVRKAPWNGVMVCNDYKAACPQNATDQTPHKLMGEDCLYANVFQGVKCNKANLCPVIYYIHSGGYEFDAATMFEPEILIDNFASKDLIFVTLGYRLGVLGFWSTGTDDAIGNWAMEDMVEGAKWIQREIRHFGGDKSRVTVQGYSSSAMAISLLTMSQKTIGLFQQAIIMSGTSVSKGAMNNDVTEYQDLAIRMNCATKSDWKRKYRIRAIIRCMRTKDPQLMVNEFNALREGDSSHDDASGKITLPRNDGPNGLFPYPLEQMISNRRPFRTMTGTTKNEMGFMKESMENATALSVAFMCNSIVDQQKFKNPQQVLRQCLNQYMFSDTSKGPNDTINPYSNGTVGPYSYWTEKTVELYEDVRYFAPCHQEVISLVTKGSTVYLYSFDYEKLGEEGITPFHSFDLAFIIGLHPFEFDERDKQIQSLYLPLFTNFAKFGDPTLVPVGNTTWTPVTIPNGLFNYLSVDIPLRMKPDFHKSGVVFWNYKVPGIEDIKITSKNFVLENKNGWFIIALCVVLCLGIVFTGNFMIRKHRFRLRNENVKNYETFTPIHH